MSSNRVVDLRKGRKAAPEQTRGSFSARSKRQSPLRARRKKMRAVLTAFGCVALLGCAYAIHLASYFEQVTFQDATVRGTKMLSASDIQIFTKKYFVAHAKGYISEANIFIFDSSALEKQVANKFRRIKTVNVESDGFFKNTLTLAIEERQSFARWCQTIEDATRCFAMDSDGYVFEPIVTDATSSLASSYTFVGSLATSTDSFVTLLPIGGRYAAGHFRGILSLLEALGQNGYAATSISTENSQDLRIHLEQGFDIKVSFGAALQELVKNLKLVLSSDALKNKSTALEYVDLRFGNRVYYKFIGAEQGQ